MLEEFLLRLTRLGAKKAILLSDKAFAGADTLATAYTLSLAVKKINPDLIFCGRQTLVGDTAQTGPMLSVLSKTNLITNVMSIDEIGETVTCTFILCLHQHIRPGATQRVKRCSCHCPLQHPNSQMFPE